MMDDDICAVCLHSIKPGSRMGLSPIHSRCADKWNGWSEAQRASAMKRLDRIHSDDDVEDDDYEPSMNEDDYPLSIDEQHRQAHTFDRRF